MRDHHREEHRDQDGHWKRGGLTAAQARAKKATRVADRIVSCQRFYRTLAGSHFFEVTPAPATSLQGQSRRTAVDPTLTPPELIRARVDQALRAGEVAAELADGRVPALDGHLTKASPWLELTRWPEYLRGEDLTAVALLGCPPNPDTEPLLVQLSASVQRLIGQAYQAIRSGQVNEFDQIQINTFHGQPGVWNRPIQIHLRPRTYHDYCQVWQRLVCFAYRSSRPDQAIVRRHPILSWLRTCSRYSLVLPSFP